MTAVYGTYVRSNGQGFTPRPFGALQGDHPLVGSPCAACGVDFAEGDVTTLLPLGPGDSPDARERHAAGRWYSAAAIPLHAACAGVDERSGSPASGADG